MGRLISSSRARYTNVIPVITALTKEQLDWLELLVDEYNVSKAKLIRIAVERVWQKEAERVRQERLEAGKRIPEFKVRNRVNVNAKKILENSKREKKGKEDKDGILQ